MLAANIQAQIEAEQVKLSGVESDILKLLKVIESTEKLRNQLLEKRSDIIWKIEELKEELENE